MKHVERQYNYINNIYSFNVVNTIKNSSNSNIVTVIINVFRA